MSPAHTLPSPRMSRRILPGRAPRERIRIPLTFTRNSITPSLTLGMVEYSWRTPSILTQVTAAPSTELSRIRRMGFPMVIPYPRSSGSMANFPYLSPVSSTLISGKIASGLWGVTPLERSEVSSIANTTSSNTLR